MCVSKPWFRLPDARLKVETAQNIAKLLVRYFSKGRNSGFVIGVFYCWSAIAKQNVATAKLRFSSTDSATNLLTATFKKETNGSE